MRRKVPGTLISQCDGVTMWRSMSAQQRTRADPDQDHSEEQGEHGAEATKQNRKWRNQTISMPIAAKPIIASATMVSVTSVDDVGDDRGSAAYVGRSRTARRGFTDLHARGADPLSATRQDPRQFKAAATL